MQRFKKILGLSLIWFIVFAISNFYLEPSGIDYENNYIITSLYYLVVIVILTTLYKNEIGEYVERFAPIDLLFMLIFSVSVSVIYYLAGIFSNVEINHSIGPIFSLNENFLVSKSFEIMFQQCFFMISIYYLFDNNVSKYKDIILFGLYAMVIHLPILFISSPAGRILFAVSFFAGMLFSYCITKSKKGFMWSYMIHFGFYVILGVSYYFGLAPYINNLIK